jgi:metallo-beta-lactamase family protein
MQIKLTFLGATKGVTGSRFLVETNKVRVLVDCGLFQERQFLARNWDKCPFAPESLDAVLLTHAHLDHCGFIPRTVKEGFRKKIYCTPATADIVKIMLLDTAKIQEQDAANKKKRHQRDGRIPPFPEIPLYTTADANACLPAEYRDR